MDHQINYKPHIEYDDEVQAYCVYIYEPRYSQYIFSGFFDTLEEAHSYCANL